MKLSKKTKFILKCILSIILCIILFKFIPFGYNIEHIRYTHNENKLINLGVPKFSFLRKYNENSYSYKSFRDKSVLKKEIKNYVNTLKHVSCYDTTYFYDEDANVTIIDYGVKGNIIYSTISYSIMNGNYCSKWEISEYTEKLGTLNKFYTLYGEDSSLVVQFSPTLEINNYKNKWNAFLRIYYNDGGVNKVLESSSGTFKVIDDELIYYRNQIMERDKNIEIPKFSTFTIKNQKLVLKENYLSNYEENIILW